MCQNLQHTIFVITLLASCFVFGEPVNAVTIASKVVSIADGDTVTILDSNKRQYKTRLYGIDCPESGQPFGKAAKKHTAKLTAKKHATVEVYDTDRYGRTVGVVTVEGVNVNQNLIENGYAWQYRKYCKALFCSDWLRDEESAKISGKGLWRDIDPVPPWEWRKGARNSSYNKTGTTYKAVGNVYRGTVKSHKFHAPSCRHYNCKNCSRLFVNRSDAIASGYKRCGTCRP